MYAFQILKTFSANLGKKVKVLRYFTISLIIVSMLGAIGAYASLNTEFNTNNLPAPTQLLEPGSEFKVPCLVGIKLDSNNPLQIEFLIDSVEKNISENELERLVEYFLAGVTMPDEDVWVNLSPYEQDRVMHDSLVQTRLGEDLLKQDYILKQLTASLTHPKTPLGEAYWNKLSINNSRFSAESGAFSKVWISPESATLYDTGDMVIVQDAVLKVQTEADYLAMQENKSLENAEEITKGNSALDLILPELKKEINSGKHFTRLRQIYHSLILSAWFKAKVGKQVIWKDYADSLKINGVDTADLTTKNRVFNRYASSFNKGVYDIVAKTKNTNSTLQRKRFFSGGINKFMKMKNFKLVESEVPNSENISVDSTVVDFKISGGSDSSAITEVSQLKSLYMIKHVEAKAEIVDLLKNTKFNETKEIGFAILIELFAFEEIDELLREKIIDNKQKKIIFNKYPLASHVYGVLYEDHMSSFTFGQRSEQLHQNVMNILSDLEEKDKINSDDIARLVSAVRLVSDDRGQVNLLDESLHEVDGIVQVFSLIAKINSVDLLNAMYKLFFDYFKHRISNNMTMADTEIVEFANWFYARGLYISQQTSNQNQLSNFFDNIQTAVDDANHSMGFHDIKLGANLPLLSSTLGPLGGVDLAMGDRYISAIKPFNYNFNTQYMTVYDRLEISDLKRTKTQRLSEIYSQ